MAAEAAGRPAGLLKLLTLSNTRMIDKAFKDILIPVNFSESSDHAIRTGVEMCKRHQTALHLLFVSQEHNLAIPPGKNAGVFEMAVAAKVALQDEMEAQAKRIEQEHSIDCFFHTAEGVFHTAVAETADDFRCELIILQKSGSKGIFEMGQTSRIYKIIKHAACPVLTIPAKKPVLNFRKVLFPVRPLVSALEKLDVALSIIKKNHSRVLLFSAVNKRNQAAEIPLVNELTNRACYQMGINDIDIEKELNVADDMAREVVNKAVERKSDLIIITATIKKGLKALFYKNYTEKVISSSPVPVLSVKLGA